MVVKPFNAFIRMHNQSSGSCGAAGVGTPSPGRRALGIVPASHDKRKNKRMPFPFRAKTKFFLNKKI